MGTVHDITPHRLAADLRDSAARLDTLSRRIRSTAREAAVTEVAYRTAQAKRHCGLGGQPWLIA